MFSTYALQGIETKTKGVYSREELAPLAQTNVESLKEFDFFTFAKADGKKEKFLEPVDYFLEYKDGALTLHFTLPLKTPVKPKTAGAGSVRSGLLHRLQVRRQGPDQAGRGARRLPDEIPAAERRHRRRRKSSTSRISRAATIRTTARCSPTRSRWSARDAETRPRFARGADGLRRGGWPPSWLLDGVMHVLLAQTPFGAPRRAAPSRRSAASSAGCWQSNRNSTARCPRPSAPPSPTARRSGRCSRSPSPTASSTPPAPATARR